MRVSATEFIDRFDDLSHQASLEPVTITAEGRDRLVLVSAEEYRRLKQWDGTDGRTEARSRAPTDLPPELWGALRHSVIEIDADLAEPTGKVWDAGG